MEALRILLDEHQSLAAILHAIRLMLRDIGAGTLQPDKALLRAMVQYLDAYPEKRHHPKEDAFIFAPLRRRTGEGAAALDRLEDEHAHGNARIKALEDAVQRYIDGAPEGFAGFVAAFEAFADFYRDHMLREEREILPLVHKHFTAEDWAVANAGFAGSVDPMSGTRTPMVVADARQHPLFADNPLVVGEPHVRLYACVPLITPEGAALGTLAVLDTVPRALAPGSRPFGRREQQPHEHEPEGTERDHSEHRDDDRGGSWGSGGGSSSRSRSSCRSSLRRRTAAACSMPSSPCSTNGAAPWRCCRSRSKYRPRRPMRGVACAPW